MLDVLDFFLKVFIILCAVVTLLFISVFIYASIIISFDNSYEEELKELEQEEKENESNSK